MARDDFAAAFKAFAASGNDQLALFFHGGLVDKASGTQQASNARTPLDRKLNLAPAGAMPFAISALAEGTPDPFSRALLTEEQRQTLVVSTADVDDFVQSIQADESVRSALRNWLREMQRLRNPNSSACSRQYP